MAIITFMSDFGHRDHYVAAVKATILSLSPNITIIDISHEIEHFNLAHAAFVLKSVYHDFPEGSVHLVAVNAPNMEKDRLIALKLNGHYFVGFDNGLFSLLTDDVIPEVVELKREGNTAIFPEKKLLVSIAVSLSQGTPISKLGIPVNDLRKVLNRQLRVTKAQISGHVIHVDTYGNLITNISSELFDKIRQGRNFTINFAREMLDTISNSYDSTDNGDCVVLFNSSNYLEIAISQGSASQLLGLTYDSPVNVFFVSDETIPK